MDLTAKQLQSNYQEFLGYIDQYIQGERKDQLLDFYKKYEERLILLPAAAKEGRHSSFPGGYIYHVNNVVKYALQLYKVWLTGGADMEKVSLENIVFCAINHDLGKMGSAEEEGVKPQTDEWRRNKLGEMYTFNTKLSYMSVPDRSLFLLQQHGIPMSQDEWVAIKIHDGLYDSSNESYLKNYMPETKPRTCLYHIIHQADMMASYIEFEQQWLNKLHKNNLDNRKGSNTLQSNAKKQPTKQKALSSVKSAGLQDMLKNL